ncbi:MAG TPA: hypothetical protein VEH84_13940, partial [Alphaproteobacteria bacterium]|nr:hypothetical protein [Alphaproteobacteria bacterium]
LDETLRFLTDLTDRRSLPLGMDAVLAGHAETIGSFRDILRARGYAHYLEWATPEMIDGLDALIAELRARVPAMEEF